MQQTQNKAPWLTTHDEEILVVPRSSLFQGHSPWHGLKKTSLEDFQRFIEEHKEFHPRSAMEADPMYKQIIPYLVFKHATTFFLMQRTPHGNEQRLKSKYSLGIGGHIRKEDLAKKSIIDWAQREFQEEVDYQGTYTVTTLGLLNDDSNPVGEVHLGCVFIIEGDSSSIKIKSELQSGVLLTLAECKAFYPLMEGWSQMVFTYLERE